MQLLQGNYIQIAEIVSNSAIISSNRSPYCCYDSLQHSKKWGCGGEWKEESDWDGLQKIGIKVKFKLQTHSLKIYYSVV